MPTETEAKRPAFEPAVALEALLDDQHPLKVDSTEWATTELVDPTLIERDQSCTFWAEGWRRCGERGILGLVVDQAYGGQGLDLVSGMLAFEGLSVGCDDGGLIFGLSSQIWTVQMALERFGSEEQKQRWLPSMVTGSTIGCFAMSEHGAGSDALALTATATKTDDGYVLNGTKAWVTLSPVADVAIVFATINPELGRWGVTAFCVDLDGPGIEVQANRTKMGLRTTPFADIVFTEAPIPTSARMGGEGAGAAIFSSAMESERAFLLAGSVGRLERQVAEAVTYANDREQFGQPVGAFQSVSHEIASMKVAHENARNLLYKAAALQARGEPSMMAAALAKLAASEAAVAGSLSAIRVHGARGFVSEFGVERPLRDSVGGLIYGGTSGVQLNIVARLLGLPG